MNINRLFLLSAAMGLIVIALGYGYDPTLSIPYLFEIDASMVNVSHIFRAIMGLYFAFALLWLVGAFSKKVQMPAMYSLVIFMVGLGSGRILSMVVDGIPNLILCFYLFLEIVFGIVGCVLIKKTQTATRDKSLESAAKAATPKDSKPEESKPEATTQAAAEDN